MNKNNALFPGSFDPPTYGHLDIIRRAAALYGKLYVVVADNISKKTVFSASERKDLLCRMVKDIKNVEVVTWNGTSVGFAEKHDCKVIVRGVRAINDFYAEFELAMVYKQMNPEIEILFMPTDPVLSLVRSSMIKEMVLFGADVSKCVPEYVAQSIKEKLKC